MKSSARTRTVLLYAVLLGAFLVYSFSSVFSKWASMADFLSPAYLLRLSGAVGVLGIFALLWQQIIKRMPVSDAYMFKGTSIIFVLLLSYVVFGEAITVTNLIGAVLIIGGMALNAKS